MTEVFNFCAGPAMLPKAVMTQAQNEFINWNNTGSSVMELSHRSSIYMAMAAEAEADLRDLMAIPDNYKVLFCHGGGRGQFSAVPLNLLPQGKSADYIVNGSWSRDAAYVHYCPNETVDGIEINDIPETYGVPLVADMSSTILSHEIDVTKFGLIYAGAQKNIGPSGLTIVVVREDLLGNAQLATPCIMNYETSADNDSMYNTPPTYAWYLAGLVFKWLKELGGVKAIAKINKAKAELLYQAIDSNSFYQNNIEQQYRSKMNIPFWLVDESLNEKFLTQAEQQGLMALKGHRIVGGMRASVYNAMPIEGVEALVDFMQKFASENSL